METALYDSDNDNDIQSQHNDNEQAIDSLPSNFRPQSIEDYYSDDDYSSLPFDSQEQIDMQNIIAEIHENNYHTSESIMNDTEEVINQYIIDPTCSPTEMTPDLLYPGEHNTNPYDFICQSTIRTRFSRNHTLSSIHLSTWIKH